MYLLMLGTDTWELSGIANYLDPSSEGAGASAVAQSLVLIDQHVDQILSSDCQANVVIVPILAVDSAGFYSVPSNALISSLQNYLNARKEVTQTVVVTSGGNFLVSAWITVRIGIYTGYSPSQVQVAAQAVVNGLLRGRQFGVSLYVSDVWKAVFGIAGVGFVNVVINGYTTVAGGSTILTDQLDVSGNLIITTSQVITLGNVTINTPEILPAGASG
jgi:hypothetical protein